MAQEDATGLDSSPQNNTKWSARGLGGRSHGLSGTQWWYVWATPTREQPTTTTTTVRSLQGQQTKSETWFEPLGTQPLETRPIGDEEPARDYPTSTGRLLATKVTLSWGDTTIWGPGGKAKGQQIDRVSRRCGLSEGRQPGKQR